MKLSSKYYLLFIGGICLLLFFTHLDLIYVNIMEARNFITAREMLSHDHWIHTTLSLEPRYEKPPLPTWLTALSAAIFGIDSLFGLRLPAALAASFLVFSTYFISVKLVLDKRLAFINALVLATSFFIIFSGRNGQWDIFCHAFMLYAIYTLLQSFETNKPQWRTWTIAGLFLGLSFMSKGPVSFFALLLPFLIAYGLVYKYRHFKVKLLPLSLALLIFALVGLSWGIYIYLTDTSSATAIATKETLAWAERNVRPWYYYWSFFTQSGLWTYFAFISLLYPYMSKRVPYKKAYTFSLVWTLSAVVLLSFIPEKKSRYLLPILIPLAINTSFYFNFLILQAKKLKTKDRLLANFGFGLIALICIAFPIVGYLYFDEIHEGYILPFILTAVFLVGLGLFLLRYLRQKNYKNALYITFCMLPGIMLFGFPMAPMFYDNPDFNSTANIRKQPALKDIPLYGYKVTPELIWALGEPLIVLDDLSEIPQDTIPYGLLLNIDLKQNTLDSLQLSLNSSYDLNYVNKNAKGYKKRLTTKLYLKGKK